MTKPNRHPVCSSCGETNRCDCDYPPLPGSDCPTLPGCEEVLLCAGGCGTDLYSEPADDQTTGPDGELCASCSAQREVSPAPVGILTDYPVV